MRLYEIRDEYLELLNLADEGELTHEAIADTVESFDRAFEDKARNCIMVMKELEAGSEAAKAEMERLKALAENRKKQAERIKEYVSVNMQAIDKDKMDLGIFSLTLKKPTKVADVLDESKIPGAYFVEIPATKKLDKRLLLADLKSGPIDGAELKDGKRALLIK